MIANPFKNLANLYIILYYPILSYIIVEIIFTNPAQHGWEEGEDGQTLSASIWEGLGFL